MKNALSQIKSRFSQAVALFLSVWISGVACVLCCGTLAAQTVSESEKAFFALPPCHQKAAQETENRSKIQTKQNLPTMQCCPFVWQIHNKATNLPTVEKVAESIVERFALEPKFTSLTESFQTRYESPPQNRRGTYLLNCVFLI